MENYAELERVLEEYDQRFEGQENPPRPEHWGGFRIIPERFEFWEEQPYRLHKRFIFKKDESGNWQKTWIYP